ncbi:NAD(P)H:quinone oxidoreductase, type IV [Thamnocephalis sphaerospora]|uniref:NAD(P)H:quinone oxidoreductase, type IV n=1 Tax=Thamnocephalis sphaerospora TaxID=78915 RepID=A0A4P9XK78_9FUNG|nr:NAD(P)H:quinone oxidoreductase, type IV [Thamnocephalis sphaerospora]|eukprot:RKP05801.1 NAD(P)H:quinone oxidoreductase, type IV [Thamnocephalis sphaerospora]
MSAPIRAKINIVYYSTYTHVQKLAEGLKRGAERVANVDVNILQVAETLPEEVLAKMGAPAKPENVPVATPDDLVSADGILLGFPTRFGMVPAQMKAFLDSTGGLWATGALRGKQAGLFFSTNTQHGGQETTAFTLLPYLAHQGLQYVPFGYGHPAMQKNTEVIGSSPYGAGIIAGVEGDSPSKTELEIAEAQGEYFAKQVLIRVLGEKAAEQQ